MSTILNDEKYDYETGTLRMSFVNKKDIPINLQPKKLLVDDVIIPQFTFFNEQINPKHSFDIDIVMDGVITDLPTFKKSIDLVLMASSIDGSEFEKEITINHKL